METDRGEYAIGQKAIERSWKATLDRTQLIIYLNSNSLKSACRGVYALRPLGVGQLPR